LTSAAAAAVPSDSFSAATASGSVTTSQNEPMPSARDAQIRAAIGRTTISVR
jgi:hypothetical protein